MRFMHLADLHLGKRLNEFSLIEDQKYILDKILQIAVDEHVDAVVIAGDVYDKSVPSAESVELFDSFLTSLSSSGISVLVISGNHDSPERMAFGGRLMSVSGVYMSPVYNGVVGPVVLKDCHGEVNFWLLPFLKPSTVRRFFDDEHIVTYDDAVRTAVNKMDIDLSERNVIVSHQFVTGALRCDSEEISVGGADNIFSDIYAPFDYAALGHIHRAQRAGADNARYSGTPLKYSFSEVNHTKTVTVVDIESKGEVLITEIPLIPMRGMSELRGSFEEIMSPKTYEGTTLCDDFLHITLTDDDEITDAMGKLRKIYSNVLRLDYDNIRTRSYTVINGSEYVEKKSPLELFGELYEKQNGQPMQEDEKEFISLIAEKVLGEEAIL